MPLQLRHADQCHAVHLGSRYDHRHMPCTHGAEARYCQPCHNHINVPQPTPGAPHGPRRQPCPARTAGPLRQRRVPWSDRQPLLPSSPAEQGPGGQMLRPQRAPDLAGWPPHAGRLNILWLARHAAPGCAVPSGPCGGQSWTHWHHPWRDLQPAMLGASAVRRVQPVELP